MAGEYTISAVSPQTIDDGEYRIYYVKLEDAEPSNGAQAFELVQKQASKAPTAGQSILVKRLQPGTRDGKPTVKIVKDWDAIKAAGSSGGGGGSGGGRQSGGRDDATGQSIERQTAAKAAAEMVATQPASSAVVMLANFEAAFDVVLGKIQGVAQVPQGASNGGGQGEIPADTTGLEPAATAPSGDDSIPF
jgi:hypothetical protein